MPTRTLPKSSKKKAADGAVKPKYPYVIKPSFLQVTIEGNPFTLDSTHPTFARMKKALETSNWKAVPRLVNLAQTLVTASAGSVTVQKGVVMYKGTPVDSRLTQRILEMIKESKDVKHMLLFMDNLYQNPQREAIAEFYDWLMSHDLPITDDGCFLAYKSVDDNCKDQHTHKIDNSPGQVIMMPRNVADLNWRTACSSGFHICSKQYGLYGTRVMAVKVNPKDVIAAPTGEHKIRVCEYEVLYELGEKDGLKFKKEGFAQLEKQLVVEVAKEAKELRKLLNASPAVKKLIRDKKVSETYVSKASYAKLKSMAQRFEVLPPDMTQASEAAAEKGKPVLPLRAARQAAGISSAQILKELQAEHVSMTMKDVLRMETREEPHPSDMNYYLNAIAKLTGIRNLSRSAITFPKPVQKKAAA